MVSVVETHCCCQRHRPIHHTFPGRKEIRSELVFLYPRVCCRVFELCGCLVERLCSRIVDGHDGTLGSGSVPGTSHDFSLHFPGDYHGLWNIRSCGRDEDGKNRLCKCLACTMMCRWTVRECLALLDIFLDIVAVRIESNFSSLVVSSLNPLSDSSWNGHLVNYGLFLRIRRTWNNCTHVNDGGKPCLVFEAEWECCWRFYHFWSRRIAHKINYSLRARGL